MYHSMKKEDVLKKLATGFSGLTDEECGKRLISYGKNVIAGKKKKGIIRLRSFPMGYHFWEEKTILPNL